MVTGATFLVPWASRHTNIGPRSTYTHVECVRKILVIIEAQLIGVQLYRLSFEYRNMKAYSEVHAGGRDLHSKSHFYWSRYINVLDHTITRLFLIALPWESTLKMIRRCFQSDGCRFQITTD